MGNDRELLLRTVRESIIGSHHEIDGPFGPRLVTYADYTASARSLTFIEDFIREHVLPYYANTHTESSETGLQTTRFREDARGIIKQAVNGTDEDVVIFTGSGATGAINKLIDILNLRLPADLDDRYHLLQHVPAHERPVVFIGPYEHHSNEVPWRESIADVVVIDEDGNGRPDRRVLTEALLQYSNRPLIIGSFSAASNVTGIGSGTCELSAILHRHGALAFWDFAAAGPYVKIDMNPAGADPNNYKDAIFLSPHKFIGGPGTPGVLVVKKKLLTNRVPTVPGGGTVAYVDTDGHRFVADPVQREEGGTPDIIGAVRAGLVFQLKSAVGTDLIREREDYFISHAIDRWSYNPNIQVLGNYMAWRLSIISFTVSHGDRYLHHNFVVTLLNDLFGIQARGGCSCAGPYGHRLLGIDPVRSNEYRKEILRGYGGIKPGWARIGFNYFISDTVFNFILDAVDFVAQEGWRFLPQYHFSPDTGRWVHVDQQHCVDMRLSDITYRGGELEFPYGHTTTNESALATYLEHAGNLAASLPGPMSGRCTSPLTDDVENLRWFCLPHEVHTTI